MSDVAEASVPCVDVGQEREMLNEEILCREEPIKHLVELLARPKNVVPQSIFLYGLHSSGKTYVTAHVLQMLKYRHIFVDCVQCHVSKILFGTILQAVNGERESSFNCDNVYDFLTELNIAMSGEFYQDNAFIVVLDNCDRLRTMESNHLPVLLRLQELSGLNICCILISTLPWEKFCTPSGLLDPFEVMFPQYTKDEILKILCCKCVWGGDLDSLFMQYVRLFLGVFFICCRDVAEVEYMVRSRFLEHCEPIIRGHVEASRLWSTLFPHFKMLGNELYLRMLPSLKEKAELQKNLSFSSRWALTFELPFYTKFFLIAAFLASYSPQKFDKILFIKKNEKRRGRKRKHMRTQDEVVADMALGPRPFTVGRLLAIFYSIVDSQVNFTANISAQIASLVKLQLLTVTDSTLDSKIFKCCVGLDFITTIAKTVGFDVLKYLFPRK